MIFVVDTSSAVSALAILDPPGAVREEEFLPARSPELIGRMRALVAPHRLTRVAVATGPGSFTGLRVGVSFGLGLAMGLRIPIVPLRTLELQAARSETPVIGISEAGAWRAPRDPEDSPPRRSRLGGHGVRARGRGAHLRPQRGVEVVRSRGGGIVGVGARRALRQS